MNYCKEGDTKGSLADDDYKMYRVTGYMDVDICDQ